MLIRVSGSLSEISREEYEGLCAGAEVDGVHLTSLGTGALVARERERDWERKERQGERERDTDREIQRYIYREREREEERGRKRE